MRGAAVIAIGLAVGCASDSPAPRAPLSAHEIRCTLRVSSRGLYVDGERTSRDAAVAQCKRADEGATVVLDIDAPKAEWEKTRVALEREGVRLHVRGPLCYGPYVESCRPRVERVPMRVPKQDEPVIAKPEKPAPFKPVEKAEPPPPVEKPAPPPAERPAPRE